MFVPAEYEWLLLRYDADRRSRAENLLQRAQAAARGKRHFRVLDLGAGSGGNFLYLAPRLPALDQEWMLIDRDPALVARVDGCIATLMGASGDKRQSDEICVENGGVRFTTAVEDFLDSDARIFQSEFDLVVANAVFDLLSDTQIERFFRLAEAAWSAVRPPLYFTINLDEGLEFFPVDHRDQSVCELFHAHMRRCQWFGRALGAESARFVAALAERVGFRVTSEASSWNIRPHECSMLRANLDFVAHGVREMLSNRALGSSTQWALSLEEFEEWLNRRREEIAREEFGMMVAHRDLWIEWA